MVGFMAMVKKSTNSSTIGLTRLMFIFTKATVHLVFLFEMAELTRVTALALILLIMAVPG